MRTHSAVSRVASLVVAASAMACASVPRAVREPLVADRPDFTEASETVGKGVSQLEVGSTFSREGGLESHTVGEVLARIGVASRAELRVALNSYAVERLDGATSRGLEDAALGLKLALGNGGGEGSWKPATAILVASSFPTGARPFRASRPAPEAKFAASWEFNSRVGFASNLNYARVPEGDVTAGEVSTSGSFAFSLTDRVGSYAEYFAFFPQQDGAVSAHYVNGGFTFGVTPDFQLDARAGYGLRHVGGPNYFVGIGIARRW
jgi:Putative MetA-pathway of phenol degradation